MSNIDYLGWGLIIGWLWGIISYKLITYKRGL